jgi:tetratricopeptide (TPR) repeat protein
MNRWARIVVAIAVVVRLGASSATADSSDRKDEARALMQSGLKLFNDKDYIGALATFTSAYKQFSSTKILLNIATTLRQLGRNAEAANTYQRYLQASDSDVAKRPDVEKVLRDLDASLAILDITVQPSGAEIVVNTDEPFNITNKQLWRVNPGKFTINATHSGFQAATTSGTIVAAQTKSIQLTMVAVATVEEVPVTVVAPTPAPWGGLLRAHVDFTNRGAAALVGGFFEVADRVAFEAAGILGPTYGGYLGATGFILQGKIRPTVSVGAPIFFSHGARWAARAAVGIQLRIGDHIGFFIEAGGEHHFNPEADIKKNIFIPAVGITGRL